MACLDMYNNNNNSKHKSSHCPAPPPPMSPRISFSNDFVDSQQMMKISSSRSEAPVSTDFEFSVSNYSMMSADELFFKGRLLPFKDNIGQTQQRTIRDELLVVDEEDEDHQVSLRPPKGSTSTRWKGLLGLKKSHIGSKKVDKSTDESVERVGHVTRTSQELLSEGGPSCRDVEIGI